MNIIKRVFLALNQSTCLIITGQNDFTLSGYSYVRAVRDGKPLCMDIVDALFFWQEGHCKNAFLWEMRSTRTLFNKFRWILESIGEEDEH